MIEVGSRVVAINDGSCYCKYIEGWIGKVVGINNEYNNEYYNIEFENGQTIINCWAGNFKEIMGMIKEELKTGMLVQMRDKRWGVVVDESNSNKINKIVLLDGNFYHLTMNDINPEKPKHSYYDIIKVATINYFGDLFRHATKLPGIIEKLSGFKVIWEEQNEELKKAIERFKKAEDAYIIANDELKEAKKVLDVLQGDN
jgi:hypothetical protein